MRNTMRVCFAVLILCAGLATPAAAADVDHGPSIVDRVLEVVSGWAAKLGADWEPGGVPVDAGNAKDGDEATPTNGGDEDDPPLDGYGAEFDPNG